MSSSLKSRNLVKVSNPMGFNPGDECEWDGPDGRTLHGVIVQLAPTYSNVIMSAQVEYVDFDHTKRRCFVSFRKLKRRSFSVVPLDNRDYKKLDDIKAKNILKLNQIKVESDTDSMDVENTLYLMKDPETVPLVKASASTESDASKPEISDSIEMTDSKTLTELGSPHKTFASTEVDAQMTEDVSNAIEMTDPKIELGSPKNHVGTFSQNTLNILAETYKAHAGNTEPETVENEAEDQQKTENIPNEDLKCVAENERKKSCDWQMVPITADFDMPLLPEQSRFDRTRICQLMSRWRSAARRATRQLNDPWDEFHILNLPPLRAKRFRYSAIRQNWTEDFIEVRLHPEPFARGAMRECYRLKKRATSNQSDDWSHAQNYVAKKYMQDVERRVLFEDVKLQMDAKLWAEEYNRYRPPKKIDIMQMCLIEIIDLPGSPLFHLEHFIEGKYLKYNSNSGFVSDVARMTPQAFSHFTFERSGHQMIIVDVQGVGDLYTDPQIHTIIGTDYGDGNLGTRGMALFFHSHECNAICHSLCMSQFDLSSQEIDNLANKTTVDEHIQPTTVYDHRRSPSACIAIADDVDAMECLRVRTRTISSRSKESAAGDHGDDCICAECVAELVRRSTETPATDTTSDVESSIDPGDDDHFTCRRISARSRFSRRNSMASSTGTESISGVSSRMTRDTDIDDFWRAVRQRTIPAEVVSALELCDLRDDSRIHQTAVLGQIHVDIARYHELGRFLPDIAADDRRIPLDTTHSSDSSTAISVNEIAYDKPSALFHLNIARKCGCLEAILTIAQIVYDIPHELLKSVSLADLLPALNISAPEASILAFELMEIAAEMGDKSAMLFVADAYETGRNLAAPGHPSFNKAISWYQRVVGFQDEDDQPTSSGPLPRHAVLAKMAEMYREGGYGLDQDLDRAYTLFTEAAEAAMEAMNGKLANKYYEKAEMCA